jgi:hypothetical protein
MKTESKIQQECMMWYRNTHLKTDNIFASIPNEGKNAIEQMRKKAIGMYAGFSDTIVIHFGKVLFIEFKDEKGRQSDKQKEFEIKIKANGFEYHLVRSLEQFKQIIK